MKCEREKKSNKESNFWLSLIVLFSFDSDFFSFTVLSTPLCHAIWMWPSVIVVAAAHFVSLEPIWKEKARCEKSKLNFYLLLLFFIRLATPQKMNNMKIKWYERNSNEIVCLFVVVVVGCVWITHILLLASAWSLFFTRPSQFFAVVEHAFLRISITQPHGWDAMNMEKNSGDWEQRKGRAWPKLSELTIHDCT